MKRLKIITCILPSGRALELLETLRTEHAIGSAFAHHARDVSFQRAAGVQDLADESEVITVLAPEESADALFEVLREAVGLDAPGSGIVFMERTLVARASDAPLA